MKVFQRIAIIVTVILCAFGLNFMSIQSQAAGSKKTPVQKYTVKECSVWSSPNTSEQYRVKKIPAGYGVMLYEKEIQSTKNDGKTFYKTASGNYILCNCFAQESDGYLSSSNFDYDWYYKMHPEAYEYSQGNQALAWNYYLTYGKPAGWLGRRSKESYLKRYEEETLNVLYSAANQITSTCKDQTQIVRAVHDWVCNHVDYDYSYSRRTLDEAVQEGLSVCSGYSSSFDMLAKLCGIETEIISGEANNGTKTAGHAWNSVSINGKVSYVDTTWDDFTNKYGIIVYYCFMIDEAEMNRIHNGTKMHFVNGEPRGYY